ncbi:hypothetical protein RUM44_011795 [Polyplax serrata]|uniref:Uncharacterized protein n=1 Tax=Polyplax serrata TaxID=468196 RepID=A0ABR1AR45_POLSC
MKKTFHSTGTWRFEEEYFSQITQEAKDFISKLLVFKAEDRMDVKSALRHPWLQRLDTSASDDIKIETTQLRSYHSSLRDWYKSANCRPWYRREVLNNAFTHPSKMVYPPGEEYYFPENLSQRLAKPSGTRVPVATEFPSREPLDYEVGHFKSESQYQCGPDTYLLQLRDVDLPCRLRHYMKVAADRQQNFTSEPPERHIDWRVRTYIYKILEVLTPVIRERRKFMDIMDEEIDDERRARIDQYGSDDVYSLRRLKHEIGCRSEGRAEAEAMLQYQREGHLPFFVEKPRNLSIVVNKPAEFSCLVVGEPEPVVQWFKNDLVVAETSRIKMVTGQNKRFFLKFNPALQSDVGIYKVVAKNKVGQSVARMRLVHATVPLSPDPPETVQISENEILLRWKHDNRDVFTPTICYSLQYKETESSEWITVAKNIDHEFWLLKNLKGETSYDVRLCSRNCAGWSAPGLPLLAVKTLASGSPQINLSGTQRKIQLETENKDENWTPEEMKGKIPYEMRDVSSMEWDTRTNLEDKYQLKSEIFRGKFSMVVKAVDRTGDQEIAAKLFTVDSSTEKSIETEFDNLRSFNHERIVGVLTALRPASNIAIFIMEKLQGTDILSYFSLREEYDEDMVVTALTQVLDGLQYLHWKGFCHLNIQPDNIVMSCARTLQIKLVDFGSAQKVSKLGTIVPAPVTDYSAPEIRNKEPVFPQTDVWSLGVVAYVLLSGVSPFKGDTDEDTQNNIIFVRYRFEYLHKEITQEATRFLMQIFKRTPTKRPTVEECYDTRWLLSTESMIKKRQKACFPGRRLKAYCSRYHSDKTDDSLDVESLSKVIGENRLRKSDSVELVILVDGSDSVGQNNFLSEIKFIQKVISDVKVGPKDFRLGIVIYGTKADIRVDHLSVTDNSDLEKCSLLNFDIPNIVYPGSNTNTKEALERAEKILTRSRRGALKVIFLVSDGFSNMGDPYSASEILKEQGTIIFTFGIQNGNVRELREIATKPADEHSFLFASFDEFEGFARRALHNDLSRGVYAPVKNSWYCDHLCSNKTVTNGCCSQDATCSCGLISGHFACLCPPGYYGSGLVGEGCTLCPEGTYNEGLFPGDSLTCIPCPDVHHVIAKYPATNKAHCICSNGTIPMGNACKIVSCPSLSPPPNGYFVKKSCSNAVNAACGVRCHMGYHLVGSSVRICQGSGTWSGTSPICTPKYCDPPKPVADSAVTCTNEEDMLEINLIYDSKGNEKEHTEIRLKSERIINEKVFDENDFVQNGSHSEYAVGTACSYSCLSGYSMIGSKSRSCLPLLKWSGLKPTCKSIRCPSLPEIPSGSIKPKNCTLKGLRHYFGTVCRYQCNPGYELKGPKLTNCTERHGSWSAKNTPSRCIDVEPPKIDCPKNMTIPTETEVNFATVKLSLPNTTDNSGSDPVIWSKPPFEEQHPLRLTIGETKVEIYSVDEAGNYGFCQFTVFVTGEVIDMTKDEEKPKVLECQSPPTFYVSQLQQSQNALTWREPVFDDNSGIPISVTRHPMTETFPMGTTPVTYTGIDAAGNSATSNPCSERPKDTNTLWNCSIDEHDVTTCNVSCSEGFTFITTDDTVERSSLILSCAFSGRKAFWSPDLFQGDIDLFPECSELFLPEEMSEIVIDDSRDLCNDLNMFSDDLLNGIVDNEYNVSVFAYCDNDNNWDEEDASVVLPTNEYEADYEHESSTEPQERTSTSRKEEEQQTETSVSEITLYAGSVTLESRIFDTRVPDVKAEDDEDDLFETRESNDLTSLPVTLSTITTNSTTETNETEKNHTNNYVTDDTVSITTVDQTEIEREETTLNIIEVTQGNEQMRDSDRQRGKQVKFEISTSTENSTGENSTKSTKQVQYEYQTSTIELLTSKEMKMSADEKSMSSRIMAELEIFRMINPAKNEEPDAEPKHVRDITHEETLEPTEVERNDFANGNGEWKREMISSNGLGSATEEKDGQRKRRHLKEKRKKIRIAISQKGGRGKEYEEATDRNIFRRLGIIKKLYGRDGGDDQVPETANHLQRKLRCRVGSLLKNRFCVKCPKGTYHNVSSSRCDPCPRGEYQEIEGQLKCISCPPGFSTRKIRRKNLKQCRRICPAGTYGKKDVGTGLSLAPCTPCPIGFFQPRNGQTSCQNCPDGYTTVRPGTNTSNLCINVVELNDPCFKTNCSNGGSCSVLDGFPLCICLPGFLGSFCERSFEPCGTNPCYNGGTCRPTAPLDYECECLPGFEGSHCESETNECLSDPCNGHGECTDLLNGFKCDCFPGFRGTFCNETVSVCEELNPCLNSGVCVEANGTYRCICLDGFSGVHCDVVFECDSSECRRGGGVATPETQNGNLCENFPCPNNMECQILKINPNVLLRFPKYGVSEYILVDFPPGDLKEISVCVWLKTKDTFNYGTIFSYATHTEDNSLTLTDYSGVVLYVSGRYVVTDIEANDGFWHFICVTWESKEGRWAVFLDGSLFSNGTLLSKDSVIPGGGKLVVGQEQDTFGGGFNDVESFAGEMTQFDIWSTVLNSSEIMALYEDCDNVYGNFMGWPKLLQNLHGDIVEEKSMFCKTCNSDLNVFRGKVSYDFSKGRKIAKYTCDEGFIIKFDDDNEFVNKRVNSYVRTCMKFGGWHQKEPKCARVSCGFPGYFLQGRITGTSYKYEDVVVYHCSEGYRLDGNNTRICTSDGTWSGETPQCRGHASECRKLRAPRRGSMFVYYGKNNNNTKAYSLSHLMVGDRIEFICNKGYTLSGFGVLTCTEGGNWDRQQPTCNKIRCQFPKEIAHFLPSNINESASFYFEDVISFTCPSGSRQNIHCGQLGTWNFSTEVVCKSSVCRGSPSGVQNGYLIVTKPEGTSYRAGEKLKISCLPGFRIQGNNFFECSQYGTWIQQRPTICHRASCGPPPRPPPSYRIVHEEGHNYGDKIFLRCAPGYRSFGEVMIRCQANGRYSRVRNLCTEISCGVPSLPNGYKFHGSTFTFGSKIGVTCPAGLTLVNSSASFLECQANGKWSPAPACV